MKKINLIFKNRIEILVTFCFICVSFQATAGNPTVFKTIDAMIEDFNDYSASNGTFKILSQKPLHIQLSPQIMKTDSPENIEDEINRTLIYGVYRTFIHTPVKKIKVTVIPQEVEIGKSKVKLIPHYKKTAKISKSEALDLVKKYLKVDSFSDLVTVSETGFKDQWIKDFDRLYYNSQGSPGLKNFSAELTK